MLSYKMLIYASVNLKYIPVGATTSKQTFHAMKIIYSLRFIAAFGWTVFVVSHATEITFHLSF